MKKNGVILFSILMILSILSGCGNSSKNADAPTNDKKDDKQLKIGFNPGPYIDQFKLGIEPILKEKGYKIKYVNFTDGIQPNLAVAEGTIDANVFQHTLYMESINDKENIDLTGAVQVPTPPMGLYSSKHKKLEAKKGTTVSMPSDPVNMTRAMRILEDIGWITLKKDVDPIKISQEDIAENKYNIKIIPMEAAQGPRALQDVDYVAVQGNFAVSSGLKLTSALQLEKMESPYINVVAVKKENVKKQYVKDIIDAYHSKEFKAVISSTKEFEGYTLPDYFK